MRTIQVLIVDDCAMTRKMVQRALCRAQFGAPVLEPANSQKNGLARVDSEQWDECLTSVQALEAASAADALAILHANRVDLIFSDINMPGMDGLKFLRQVRSVRETRDIPVVMITADASASRVAEALAQGANDYLKKPFSAQEVRDRTERLLGVRT